MTFVWVEFARKLELELTHSLENQLKTQAEVEELQQQKRNCIEILDDDAIEIAELKAEVEKLRSQLNRAVEIAEDLSSGDAWKFTAADEKLAALKGEIK
jgi:cell shape-determining protein MreC